MFVFIWVVGWFFKKFFKCCVWVELVCVIRMSVFSIGGVFYFCFWFVLVNKWFIMIDNLGFWIFCNCFFELEVILGCLRRVWRSLVFFGDKWFFGVIKGVCFWFIYNVLCKFWFFKGGDNLSYFKVNLLF